MSDDRHTQLHARRARLYMPRSLFYDRLLPLIFAGLGVATLALVLLVLAVVLGVSTTRAVPALPLNAVYPFLSTAIMTWFALSVLQRWSVRHAAHFLFWGVGLALFAVAAFAEAYFAVGPFNEALFIVWYVGGALLSAAWIGQESLLLLVRRPGVRRVTIIGLVAASLFAFLVMLATPFDPSQAVTGAPVSEWYRAVLPQGALVRALTPFFNIYGTLTLVGGALWSSLLFWRKRVLPSRVMGNILIALGTLVIASASTLTRLGLHEFLYLGELVAAALMYAGFRLAAAPAPEPVAAPSLGSA